MTGRRVLYRLFDEAGNLLYVGITLRLSQRLREHADSKSWWPEVATVTQEKAPSYLLDALRVETYAIAKERPRYNVRAMAPEVPEPIPGGGPLIVRSPRGKYMCAICKNTAYVNAALDSCRIKHGHLGDLRSPAPVQL